MTFLSVVNLLGTSVFAITGVLTAVRKKFDPIGILVLSTVTAIGGGTVRDILLGINPVSWIRDINVLYVIFATVFLSVGAVHFSKVRISGIQPYLLVADALGLGLFTIGGVQVAQEQNVHFLIAIVMGTITGSAGGVIRDVLANEEPLLFRQTELYATTSIVGASLYILLEYLGIDANASAVAGMIAVAGLRMAALKFAIKLPVFNLKQ